MSRSPTFRSFERQLGGSKDKVYNSCLTYGIEMSSMNVETILEARGQKFVFSAKLVPGEAISMKVVSIDQTERWSGDFASSYIEELTSKAGALKKIQVFWKMLTTAAFKMSKSVRLEIIPPGEFELSGSDEIIGVLLTLHGEFDKIRYNLQLAKQPFTNDELVLTARKLFAEITRLKERIGELANERSVDALETQVADLTSMINSVEQEKDSEISRLKRKLRRLQARSELDETSFSRSSTMSPISPRSPRSPQGSPDYYDRLNMIRRPRMQYKDEEEKPRKR